MKGGEKVSRTKKTAALSFKVRPELKAAYEKCCDDLGFSQVVLFEILAAKVIQEQRIPFEITANPQTKARAES